VETRSSRHSSRGSLLLSRHPASFSLSLSLSLSLSSFLPRDHSAASFALAGLVGLLCCPRTKCIVVKLSHARSTGRRRRDSEEGRRKPQPVNRRNRETDIRGICHLFFLCSRKAPTETHDSLQRTENICSRCYCSSNRGSIDKKRALRSEAYYIIV